MTEPPSAETCSERTTPRNVSVRHRELSWSLRFTSRVRKYNEVQAGECSGGPSHELCAVQSTRKSAAPVKTSCLQRCRLEGAITGAEEHEEAAAKDVQTL